MHLRDVQLRLDLNAYVASTSFIAFHFMAMTKTNKFNDGEFQQVVVLSVGTWCQLLI